MLALALLGLVAMALGACAAGDQLQTRANYVSSEAERIHEAAYNCAEREIALAESHLDFGQYEMERGDYYRARDHIDLAYTNVEAAAQVVDARPECWPDYVADSDGDGLLDPVDDCPLDPEDFDQWEDEDGCPESDNDGDGLADVVDGCPNDPEDFDMWEDEDGCPDLDNDGDGYADLEDGCPNEPEDFDGQDDEDGCPDEFEYVTETDTMLEISEQIHFEYDSARILPDSYPILDEIVRILRTREAMELRIEGHTDSDGSDRYNQRLSDERAASCRTYLIEHGIASERLVSIGYGESNPIASNSNEEGKALNRRVEFHITAR
jgi:outer membrane protein OmpA-like peptidoglycan-associated protein